MPHTSDRHRLLSVTILILCLLLFSLSLEAQERLPEVPAQTIENAYPLGLAKQPRQTFLTLGGSVGSLTQQDAALSPLRYSGAAVGANGELRAYSRDVFVHIGSNVAFGVLFPVVGRERNLNSSISALQTNSFASVAFDVLHSEDRTMRLYAGGLLNVMVNAKLSAVFGNSASVFDVYASLGAMAHWEQDFRFLSKQWRGTSQIRLPLAGFAARPYYSTTFRSAAANDNIFAAIDVQGASIFNFPSVMWRTSLDYMLTTGNWLSLAYEWDFYDYNRFNRVQNARQAVSLTLHLRLE